MPIQIELPENHFDTIIRCIKKFPLDRVDFLRNATFHTLKRLRVKRDLSKAVSGIPKGSDHLNVMSIVVWMSKISARNDQTEKAVAQIVAIDATCVARSTG
jgi:hypothetical protein